MSDLYDRQKTLELKTNQSITVVGCGGIGFWVAKFAVMSGIENIYLFDPDILEEHNFNRLDIPDKFLGQNKAVITKLIINSIRPQCSVYSYPYKFSETYDTGTDWLIDCTDNYESQIENQRIAKMKGMKYVKAGYDGEGFSIHNSVAEWGEADDGYQIVPSWVVPASIVAAMIVAKIVKYTKSECVTDIKGLFKVSR